MKYLSPGKTFIPFEPIPSMNLPRHLKHETGAFNDWLITKCQPFHCVTIIPRVEKQIRLHWFYCV